jgi:hypothetical protein
VDFAKVLAGVALFVAVGALPAAAVQTGGTTRVVTLGGGTLDISVPAGPILLGNNATCSRNTPRARGRDPHPGHEHVRRARIRSPLPQPWPRGGSIGIRLLDVPADTQDDLRARIYIVDFLPLGSVIHRRVQVTNNTTTPQRKVLYPGAASIKNGSFNVVAGDTPNDLPTWITLTPSTLTLQPGASKADSLTGPHTPPSPSPRHRHRHTPNHPDFQPTPPHRRRHRRPDAGLGTRIRRRVPKPRIAQNLEHAASPDRLARSDRGGLIRPWLRPRRLSSGVRPHFRPPGRHRQPSAVATAEFPEPGIHAFPSVS